MTRRFMRSRHRGGVGYRQYFTVGAREVPDYRHGGQGGGNGRRRQANEGRQDDHDGHDRQRRL